MSCYTICARLFVVSTRAPLRGRLTPPATLVQGRIQLSVKGEQRRGQSFGATTDLIMPTATCAELMTPCCVVCLMATSRSDKEYGCHLRKKNMKRTEREDNQ